MVELGLKNLGYHYIVIDDHWEGGRDTEGRFEELVKRTSEAGYRR